MRLSRTPSHAERGGFTLIELLVVIAIIGILVALTSAAVMRALFIAPRTTARYDISQMETSVASFQTGTGGYGMDYIPSRIILRKFLVDYYVDYNTDPTFTGRKSDLDFESVTYLTNMFKGSGQKFRTNWLTVGINWQTSWSAATKAPGPGEMLEGDQCLVFFLGGIQTTDLTTGSNGCIGFSTNNANPDQLTGDHKSFYEFKSNRLYIRRGSFFSYEDGYGKRQPYAYFTASAKDNAYNRYDLKNNYAGSTKGVPMTSDCQSLGVWPYAESATPPRFLKPKTFQIICAGADGLFGPGTDATSASPYFFTTATFSTIPQAGKDDQANFAANVLSGGQ